MTVLGVSHRFYVQLRRNPYSLAILIGLPFMMILMFFIAFSSVNSAGNTTYIVAVINRDQGLDDSVKDSLLFLKKTLNVSFGENVDPIESGFSSLLLDVMNKTNYPGGNDKKIFSIVEETNLGKAMNELEQRNYDALIIIPDNFSNATISAINNNYKLQQGVYLHDIVNVIRASQNKTVHFPIVENASIQIIGDDGFLNYQISKEIISLFIDGFRESFSPLSAQSGKVSVNLEAVVTKNYSVFDNIVPGIMVLALLMQGGMLSAIITQEYEVPYKTFTRIRLSLIHPWDYIIGATLVQLAITPIQIGVLFGASFILGFSPAGNIVLSFIILWIGTLFGLTLTFISAAIFTNAESAGASSGYLATPLAFASGAFFDIPPITLMKNIFPTATGGTRDLLVWDLIPSTHLMNALKPVLLYDSSLDGVIIDLTFFLLLTLVLLGIAIFVFKKRRFQGDI